MFGLLPKNRFSLAMLSPSDSAHPPGESTNVSHRVTLTGTLLPLRIWTITASNWPSVGLIDLTS
jgi:hypothetical protein